MRRIHEIFRGRGPVSACVVAAALTVVAGPGRAEPDVPTADALRLSGFGTLGLSHASTPPGWGFMRESSQPLNDGGTRADTDSRLGLQANYQIDPRFELVGQLLLMRRASDTTANDSVAWAFAAFRPIEGLALRVGRLSSDLYLLSDYRSVGVGYPFVRPPTEYYGSLPSSFDGIDATRSWRDGSDAVWAVKGFYGQTRQDNAGGYLTARPAYGLVASRDEQGLLMKGSFSRAKVASDAAGIVPLLSALQMLSNAPVPDVAAGAARLQRKLTLQGRTIDYLGLGFNYDRDDWLWMMEANRIDVRHLKRIDGGYVLVGHRFGRATPYVSLSAVRTTQEFSDPVQWAAALTPLFGPEAAARAQALGSVATGATNMRLAQRTLALGLRWELLTQASLKFQYDHSRIGERGSQLWSNGTAEAASAHVLSVAIDFVF